MALKINLLLKKEEKGGFEKIRKFLFSGTSFFMANLIIIGSTVFVYWLLLSRQVGALKKIVDNYQREIHSLAKIEERRSLLAAKLGRIEKIYSERKDFRRAVEEIERLFGEKLKIKTLELNAAGEAKIVTAKGEKTRINPQVNLPQDISHLQLDLLASTSAELAEFVDNLERLRRKGLSRASLISLKQSKEGGYEMKLKLIMGVSEIK